MPRAGATGVVLVRSGSYAPAVVRRFRQRLRTYWWLWAAIVVAVVILNEVFDRKVAGDENGHPGGDLLIAIAVVLIVAAVWEFATRASRRT
jgi:4-amino-4-deoxy-L-arabinose transferase-like glycosyltransferase